MTDAFTTPWTGQFSEQMNMRLEKRQRMLSDGMHPYKSGFSASDTAQALRASFDAFSKEELQAKNSSHSICGRVMLQRDFGKAAFLDIDDGTARLQVYISRNDLSEQDFNEYKLLDYGDLIFAEGMIFRTNKGELSIHAKKFKILTKAIRPLPEKFHGLTDPELRYRMRYVDMTMNAETREVFRKRSEMVSFIRRFFAERDYLEVETPMMHPIAGGATARPFTTHHNALDMELYLRIAPELYLKRLLVGGFQRVFELNRCFRNEGLSYKHNPEFTQVEFYQAYATYEDLMELTEELFSRLVKEVFHKETVEFEGKEISFKRPFARLPMREAVAKYADIPLEKTYDKDTLLQLLTSKGLSAKELQGLSCDRLMVTCFEEFAEKNLIQPTFVTQFPTEISPLARRNDQNPDIVDRFELMVNGWEVANAFNELNNPTDQLARFAEQADRKAAGDQEACDVDYDYVRALEYGMPPAAGEGIGIDRLLMILTGQHNIRDVILFPHLKRETFF